jgi:hypothetical protein
VLLSDRSHKLEITTRVDSNQMGGSWRKVCAGEELQYYPGNLDKSQLIATEQRLLGLEIECHL